MNTVINGEYTCIPNELIKETSLSLGAFKVYAVMRSKRNDWKFYRSTLAKEAGCGLKSLNKYIDELVDAGWLQKHPQCRNNGGFSYVDYIVLGEKKSPTPAVKEQPKPNPSIVETPTKGQTLVTFLSQSLLVSSVISVCGIIGMISLTCPNLARLLTKRHSYSNLCIFASAIALVLLIATNLVAEYVNFGIYLPISATMSIISLPLMFLVFKK